MKEGNDDPGNVPLQVAPPLNRLPPPPTPPAYTHGIHAVTRASPPHLVDELDGELGSRRPQRVAEGDGAAVDVRLLEVESHLSDHRERLRRESLVELDEIYLVEREAGQLQDLRDGDRGAYPHDLRPHPPDGEPDEARERREAASLDRKSVV